MLPVVRYLSVFLLSSITLISGCGIANEPLGELPSNLGYLRASGPTFGKLIIFDAKTFDIHRTIDLPQALRGDTHGLERDDRGRIWIGYSQEFTNALPWAMKEEVLVFSPVGELEHALETDCGPPEGGIAFSNEYAFIGCVWSGFKGKLAVVDTETMEIVKIIGGFRPEGPGLSDRRPNKFFVANVKEIAGNILVLGKGSAPRDYQRITYSRSGAAMIASVDIESLEIRKYNTSFPPGSKIIDAVEVDGMAWLLNSWSHIPEKPPRIDIYVMDPKTLEVVDSFNLSHPYPVWGKTNANGDVYIVHDAYRRGIAAGMQGGVTRINPETREETYWRFHPEFGGRDILGFDFNQDQPCLVQFNGLWCADSQGKFEQVITQEDSIGILFEPPQAE